MKIEFDNRQISNRCTVIAYYLILGMSFLGILAVADVLFRWDILTPAFQRLAYLIMWASVIIIFGCFLISLMVNMNIMSKSMEDIVYHLNQSKDENDS